LAILFLNSLVRRSFFERRPIVISRFPLFSSTLFRHVINQVGSMNALDQPIVKFPDMLLRVKNVLKKETRLIHKRIAPSRSTLRRVKVIDEIIQMMTLLFT